jgi:hypothetical protein
MFRDLLQELKWKIFHYLEFDELHRSPMLVSQDWLKEVRNSVINVDASVKGNLLNLANYPRLEGLTASYEIRDDQLAPLTSLTWLSLSGPCCPITDSAITKLVHLRELFLRDSLITGPTLCRLSGLSTLHVHDKLSVQSACFSSLVQLKSLTLLCNESIGDDEVSFLTNLDRLILAGGTIVTDRSLFMLTKLTFLMACGTEITDACLCGLTNLTSLNVSYAPLVTDDGLARLSNLTQLSPNNNITGLALERLCLVRLRLGAPSPDFLSAVLRHTSLRSLHVRDCLLDDDFRQQLTKLVNLSMEDSELRWE